MRHPLRNETVLITGAGSGIGRLMALGAARRGARIVIWDLDAVAGEAVRDEIRAGGAAAESFAVDVSDRDAVGAAAEATGPVDVVVNNAGVVTGKRLLDASDEAIERTFRINTLALYWVTRAFLDRMVERRHGTVVTISSAAGMVGVAKQADYSASKFAALGFSESLRVEMAKDATGVNSLVACPYYIDTGMFEGVATKFPLILPILKQEYVANRVLDSIEAGKQRLIMPRAVHALAPARLLPVPVFDTTPRQMFRFLASPSDVNWGGNAHGGIVMRWIDEVARACAMGWCGDDAVAVYSGGIHFLNPIHIGDVVELEARLIHTGPHSMHIAVHVRARDPRWDDWRETTRCMTIFVCRDDAGRASTVPQLVLASEEDRRLDQHARELVRRRAELEPLQFAVERTY